MQPSSLASSVLDILVNSELSRDPGSVLSLAYAVFANPNSSLIAEEELVERSLTYLFEQSPKWLELIRESAFLGSSDLHNVARSLASCFQDAFQDLTHSAFLDLYEELDLALNSRHHSQLHSELDLGSNLGMYYLPEHALKLSLLLTEGTKNLCAPTLLSLGTACPAKCIRFLINQVSSLDIQCYGSIRSMQIHALVLEKEISVVKTSAIEPRYVAQVKRKYGRILSFPPFLKPSATLIRSEGDFHSDGIDFDAGALCPGGSGCTILPVSFLYSQRKGPRAMRSTLAKTGLLRTVVSLPGGFVTGSAVKSAALVLQKGEENTSVRMVDLTSEALDCSPFKWEQVESILSSKDESDFIRFASSKEIEFKDFDLSFQHYLPEIEITVPSGSRLYSLSDLLCADPGEPTQNKSVGRQIRIRDLSDDDRFEPNYFQSIEETLFSDLARPGKLKEISGPCFLISSLYNRGLKADFFPEEGAKLFIRRPDILPFRLRDDAPGVDPSWLLMALTREEVQDQIARLVRGAAQPRVRESDLLQIRIAVPSLEKQVRQLADARQLILRSIVREKGLEDLLEEAQNEFLRDLQLKKHSISQTVFRLRTEATMAIRVNRKEDFSAKERERLTNYLSRIQNHCDELHLQLERLTDRTLLRPVGPLDLCESLERIIAQTASQNYRCALDVDSASFLEGDDEGDDDPQPIIQIAAEDFQELISNIIENARTHGFTEQRGDYLIQFHVKAGINASGMAGIAVEISNNGTPPPGGLTTQRFLARGEHGGRTGQQGLGGHHIHRIMQHVGGSVEIHQDPDSAFPFTVELFFPL